MCILVAQSLTFREGKITRECILQQKAVSVLLYHQGLKRHIVCLNAAAVGSDDLSKYLFAGDGDEDVTLGGAATPCGFRFVSPVVT